MLSPLRCATFWGSQFLGFSVFLAHSFVVLFDSWRRGSSDTRYASVASVTDGSALVSTTTLPVSKHIKKTKLLNTEEEHQMSAQLHFILVGVSRDEPPNSAHACSWQPRFRSVAQVLPRHYEPAAPSSFRGLLCELLRPPKPSNEGFVQVTRYVAQCNEVHLDHVRSGVSRPTWRRQSSRHIFQLSV